MATVGARALEHLLGELTGRDEDERPQHARPSVRQTLEDRQQKRGGFARAGLRRADEIAAGERERDRLVLNWSGIGVAFVGYGTDQSGGEPQ